MSPDSPKQKTPRVTLGMDVETARAVWHAIGTTVQLMDSVDEIPPHAPLFGQRDRLVAAAQSLDHEINHAPLWSPDAT